MLRARRVGREKEEQKRKREMREVFFLHSVFLFNGFLLPRSLALTSSFPASTSSSLKKKSDLEWKLTYVGSAESEKYDQVLDSVLVGPVFPGQYRFVFQVRR